MDSTQPTPAQVAAEVQSQAKGFFGSLTDFSFESFVTPKIIKLVYFLILIGVCFSALGFLVKSTIQSGAIGFIIGVIGAPLILILGAVLGRVYVEIIMLAFKMLETLQRIEAKQK